MLFDSRTQTFHAASLSEYENEYEQRERRRREYPNFPDTSKVEGYKSREFKQLIEPQSSQTPLRDDKNDRHDEIAEIAKSLAIDG